MLAQKLRCASPGINDRKNTEHKGIEHAKHLLIQNTGLRQKGESFQLHLTIFSAHSQYGPKGKKKAAEAAPCCPGDSFVVYYTRLFL